MAKMGRIALMLLKAHDMREERRLRRKIELLASDINFPKCSCGLTLSLVSQLALIDERHRILKELLKSQIRGYKQSVGKGI